MTQDPVGAGGDRSPEPREAPGGHHIASDGSSYPGPMTYAGLGMLNAVLLMGGGALGYLADTSFHTLPALLLTGLVAGGALGVFATRSELRRYQR